MRRFLPITMAVLFGLAAALVTDSALNRPMWRVTAAIPGSARPLRFVNDGQAFLTVHGFDASDGTRDRPRIVWWDTRIGAQLQSIELEVPDNHRFLYVTMGTDNASVVISEDRTVVPESQRVSKWWINDLETGKRRFGLSQQVGGFGGSNFSSDGHWYSYVRGPTMAVAVLDAMTGDDALVIEPPPGQVAHAASFRPGGNQIAVLWVAETTGDSLFADQMTLEFFEIPKGRSLIRKSLQGGWAFRGWNDDRIRLTKYIDREMIRRGIEQRERVVSFRIGENDLEDERDEFQVELWSSLDGLLHSQLGHDRGVRVAAGNARPGIRNVYRRFMNSTFPSVQPEGGFDETVYLKLFDPASGRTFAEFSDLPLYHVISPDWERIGCISSDGFVEMWDGTPPARLPWVAAAGLAVGAAAWLMAGKLLPKPKPRQVPELVPDSELF